METPESYLKHLREELGKIPNEEYYPFEDMKEQPEYTLFEKVIETAQKEAWSEALEFASENARIKWIEREGTRIPIIDKESILKGKI